MKKIDKRGQISIEWLLLLGAITIIMGIIIFIISSQSTAQRTSTKNTIDQLNKTIKDL